MRTGLEGWIIETRDRAWQVADHRVHDNALHVSRAPRSVRTWPRVAVVVVDVDCALQLAVTVDMQPSGGTHYSLTVSQYARGSWPTLVPWRNDVTARQIRTPPSRPGPAETAPLRLSDRCHPRAPAL